jgi:hypothetical protein
VVLAVAMVVLVRHRQSPAQQLATQVVVVVAPTYLAHRRAVQAVELAATTRAATESMALPTVALAAVVLATLQAQLTAAMAAQVS